VLAADDLRIVRGILLKGNAAGEVWAHVSRCAYSPRAIGVKRYRQTLD
jgi:hypothetical protein